MYEAARRSGQVCQQLMLTASKRGQDNLFFAEVPPCIMYESPHPPPPLPFSVGRNLFAHSWRRLAPRRARLKRTPTCLRALGWSSSPLCPCCSFLVFCRSAVLRSCLFIQFYRFAVLPFYHFEGFRFTALESRPLRQKTLCASGGALGLGRCSKRLACQAEAVASPWHTRHRSASPRKLRRRTRRGRREGSACRAPGAVLQARARSGARRTYRWCCCASWHWL